MEQNKQELLKKYQTIFMGNFAYKLDKNDLLDILLKTKEIFKAKDLDVENMGKLDLLQEYHTSLIEAIGEDNEVINKDELLNLFLEVKKEFQENV